MKKRKTSTELNPIGFLIDMAEAASFDYLAYRWEKKHGKGKINPYTAAGVTRARGRLNTTEDIIRLGGRLGAMGAFDEPKQMSAPHAIAGTLHGNGELMTTEDILSLGLLFESSGTISKVASTQDKVRDIIGICPENYETRDDYVNAVNAARFSQMPMAMQTSANTKTDEESEEDILLCKISRMKDGKMIECIALDTTITPGEMVVIHCENEEYDGIVLSTVCVKKHQKRQISNSKGVVIRATAAE